MASSDYLLCGKCCAKALYDANIDYDYAINLADIEVLCKDCSKRYEIVIRNKSDKKEIDRELPTWLEDINN